MRACLLLMCLLLAGCAQLVAERALERQQPPEIDKFLEKALAANLGFERHAFCAGPSHPCLAYLYSPSAHVAYARLAPPSKPTGAKGKGLRACQPPRLRLKLNVASGSRNGAYSLELNGFPDFPREAVVVLIHGFGVSKETMLGAALMVRHAGYQVLMVDLPGHGYSEGTLSLDGNADAQHLSRLLDALEELPRERHIIAMSMGAGVALRMAEQRDDIASLTLLAPMPDFRFGLVNYGKAYTGLLGALLPRRTLARGADLALARRDTSLADTNHLARIARVETPTLIMASEADPMSPYELFEPLAKPPVTLVQRSGRNHFQLLDWQHDELAIWQAWLEGRLRPYQSAPKAEVPGTRPMLSSELENGD